MFSGGGGGVVDQIYTFIKKAFLFIYANKIRKSVNFLLFKLQYEKKTKKKLRLIFRFNLKIKTKEFKLIFQSPQQQDWDSSTVCSALKHFERMVETTRMTLMVPGCRDTLTSALDTVVERTQDFTDSAYTSHEHRENILLLCDRAKLELNTLLRVGNSMVRPTNPINN